MMGLIFVVDGDFLAAGPVQASLEQNDYIVQAFSSKNIIDEAVRQRPSLVLLAAVLPDGSGLDLCRRIRQNQLLAKTPIVLLIPDAGEEDRVTALEYGADDCLSEPITPREVVARVQAVLRRTTRPQPILISESAEIVIDKAAMKLSVRGHEVATTTLEFRLIEYLARHRGQVFSRDVLLDAVWGEMEFITPRSVDACVRRIREKIEPEKGRPTYLKTIRGVGYRFDAAASWPSIGDTCMCSGCLGASTAAGMPSTATGRRGRSASQR